MTPTTTPTPHIRPATLADLDAILQLERSTPTAPHWAEADYHELLTPNPHGAPQYSRRTLLAVSQPESGSPQQLAGFAVARVLGFAPEAEAEIESVVVHPAHRRQGLGSALCRALMQWSSAQGAAAILLEVRAASAGAIRLYESLGFLPTGRRPAYYSHPPDDALLMQCTLPPARPQGNSWPRPQRNV